MNTHIEMLLFGILTKINMHKLRNQGAGAKGREVDNAWWAVLPFPVGVGTSPQSVTLYLLAHTPLGDTATGLQTAAHYPSVSVYSVLMESLHLGQGTEADRSGFRAGQGHVCGSAPSSEPKTGIRQDE